MTQAYVYKWRHLPTMKWYVGSRTAKGCSPDDGYICSSKVIRPLIISKPWEWHREIVEVGDAIEMRELEAEILELFDAAKDLRSFNKHNGDGKFTTLGTNHLKGVPKPQGFGEKISKAQTGRPKSEKQRATMKQYEFKPGGISPFKGKKHSEETRIHYSKIRRGKPGYPNFAGHKHTEESKHKISISNQGINSKLSREEVFDIRYNLSYSEAISKYKHKVSRSAIEAIRGRKSWKYI
jgi:NUMOD3 motif